MENINVKYFEAFKECRKGNRSMYKASWKPYENTITDFLRGVNKDVVTIGQEDITAYLSKYTNKNTRKSKESYIRSFLKFIIETNVEQSRQRVSAFVLTYAKIIPEWLLCNNNHDFTLEKNLI